MFIMTQSAARIDFQDLEASTVRLNDIAHALSWVNRYTGHAAFGFSVAAHSLAISYFLEKRGESAAVQMGGLMHDAHEAYFGDVSTPLKKYLDVVPELRTLGVTQEQIDKFQLAFRAREDAVQDMVAKKLGIDVSLTRHPAVKKADLIALYVERYALLPPDEPGEGPWPIIAGITPDMCKGMAAPVKGLAPEAVAKVFVARFHELEAKMAAEEADARKAGYLFGP
ncbi:hypothetical protein LMG26857_03333 [Achromobacter anxifer]|uniref:hypothetical protein n=1 Tax=Achromobacter anxifer TaxID=1287737 RepID=UPI00155C818D|nr:hypothetical protein [Achromobacter anxifer]CAB5514275.1 hypothetical protein LMG26857_03333 [Achromobacter anxifer]